ncbi:S-adenosylmethionine decarboxylase proenzyme isoform X2 [Atheta coriaria]|uniref:S-adenosylmethionine decarboxylase proenzyme isoform X2 n=1 Tax=Dalotia coriaria TaxID=877792 RepID=UPI0031F3FA14
MASGEDSMNDNVQFFEGVEKLVEIWFTTNDATKKGADLRKIPRSKLESLLKIVRCEIISFTSNDNIDAYVLSESSMFISKRRFILKTCGTTTPLLCLEVLLDLVEHYAGFDEVDDLFYSRKNFKRPDLQVTPHQHFDQEVELLDSLFNDGAAYCLGPVNKDCWFLYTLNPLPEFNGRQVPNGQNVKMAEPDQTLEILMTDLDPEIMSVFTREDSLTAADATKKSGIDKIIPNMIIDDYLFEPCGYSMNGVTKNGNYMTIHITPEPEFSYVSFETNVPAASYREIISRVLEAFNPRKFTITLFANQASQAKDTPADLRHLTKIGDWHRRELQVCQFKNYDLTYLFYSKFPS